MKETTFKEEVGQEGDLDQWMDEIRPVQALPGGKGIVGAIHPPQNVETKFGNRKACQVIINGSDGNTINTRLFLPEQYPVISPKSNLSKLLKHYGCKNLRELKGKEVQVEEVGEMMWNIKFE